MDEPTSTQSSDQDERIRARRVRIEKRTISRSEEGKKHKVADPEEKQKSRRKQQVANSLVKLDKTKTSTVEAVTSVRIEADHVENGRRIQEEAKRQQRLQSLQTEALTSGKKNAAVEMRWAELMELNMPLELHEQMQLQLKACTAIIKSKDVLIGDFQRELKIKDEEYVRALKRQGEDIEQLLSRMSSQYKELQQQYEEELLAIEEAFMQERKELIETNRAETDALFEKRRVMEMNYMEARQEREANYQKELNELRTKDAEDYNQLKIKLETDIQTLEQQLEEMRATYQLNTEKLEYNYRVLTERDMENSATLGQQKRKLARLKDSLSTLTAKYHNTDTKYKQENMELTEEYRRITRQYKDLQSKFRHFEIADNKKYYAIWEMHKEEVLGMVDKLLAAGKVIQTQQLGNEWEAPDPEVFEFHGAGAASHASSDLSLNQVPQAAEDTAKPGGGKSDAGEEPIKRSVVFDSKVRYMLELLSAEAGFLVDPKVKELEEVDSEQAAVQRANSILKSLNVETDTDLRALVKCFYDKVDDDEEDAFALERAADDDAKRRCLGLLVKPDQVVRTIRRFVDDRNAEAGEDVSQKQTKRKKRDDQLDEEQRASDARREQDRREEIKYWERLANIVPDSTVRTWEALEQALTKYNVVLTHRAEAIDEVSSLRQQNEELKALLSQYLSSQTVQDLIVPPIEATAIP